MSPKQDPVNDAPSRFGRVIRGGTLFHSAYWARSAFRDFRQPDYTVNRVGLRPACRIRGEIRYARSAHEAPR